MDEKSFSSSSSSQRGMAATAESQGKRPPPSAFLHSVRKPPAKPCKKPNPAVPPRVYRVEPRGFRQLVQKLTGASDSGTRCLRDVAPAPLNLVRRSQPSQPPPPPPPPQAYDNGVSLSMEYAWGGYSCQMGVMEPPQINGAVSSGLQSPVGMVGFVSPSLCSPYSAWCSFTLLSPGTVASMEQSTVL